jgi:hypothetical protein
VPKQQKALPMLHVENLFVRAWKVPSASWQALRLVEIPIAASTKLYASGTADGQEAYYSPCFRDGLAPGLAIYSDAS